MEAIRLTSCSHNQICNIPQTECSHLLVECNLQSESKEALVMQLTEGSLLRHQAGKKRARANLEGHTGNNKHTITNHFHSGNSNEH